MENIYSFDPIINYESLILILGTMPSVDSLKLHQYYGNKRNQFWKIIYQIFDEKYDENYNNRIKFLLSKKIALWDVLKHCKRIGSLDTNISHEKPNNFHDLFISYPNINHIFFNSKNAYNLFEKNVGFDFKKLSFDYLPSTSPAYPINYNKKLEIWRKIRLLNTDKTNCWN